MKDMAIDARRRIGSKPLVESPLFPPPSPRPELFVWAMKRVFLGDAELKLLFECRGFGGGVVGRALDCWGSDCHCRNDGCDSTLGVELLGLVAGVELDSWDSVS